MSHPGLARLAAVLSDPERAELADVSAAGADELIRLARAHGVEAWLAALAPPTWPGIAVQRVRFAAAARRDRRELDRFGTLAGGLGLDWLAVKGQAAGESLYPDPSWRYGVDVDVLVPAHSFGRLCHTLVGSGWELLDLNWPLLAETVPGELRFRSPGGALFDVHWHLMTSPALRAEFPFETGVLLDRRRSLPSGLPALSADDQLVHLAVHAALSGAGRLSWLLDVGLAGRQVTDWSRLDRVTRDFRARLPVAAVLRRAARWLGTPKGPPTGWSGLFALVDQISPVSAEPDRPAVARAFARSLRASGPASLAEFARHGWAFARSGAPRHRLASPLSDPTDRRSPLHDVPDSGAQAHYFDRVSAS